MKLREGAYYKNRLGDIVGPIKPNVRELLKGVVETHPWRGSDHRLYRSDGSYMKPGNPHQNDLVEEVQIP